jgi:DNA-binding Lrp family transcriptional regulator
LEKSLREIKVELMKDKRFRDELSAALIAEILENSDMNISQEEVSKRVKRLVNELIDARLEQVSHPLEN